MAQVALAALSRVNPLALETRSGVVLAGFTVVDNPKLRNNNVEFMRGLPAGDARRVALHKEAGEITLAQMLHEWAMHDLAHIRQIAELLRARKYLDGAGPLGASYNLKP